MLSIRKCLSLSERTFPWAKKEFIHISVLGTFMGKKKILSEKEVAIIRD